METAAIWAQKSERMPLSITSKAARSNTRPTEDRLRARTDRHVHKLKSNAGSTKSPPSVRRSSMFSESSKGCSGIVRRDTEVYENRAPN